MAKGKFRGRLKAAAHTYRTWRPQTPAELDAQLDSDSGETYAGKDVNEVLALNVSAVWCAVQNISQTIASLPFKLYQRQGNGKRPYPAHPLYSVLHDQPNEQMSAFIWRERMMHHLLSWGNHYSEILRDPTTERVIALWPFNNPSKMKVENQGGRIVYAYKEGAGKEKVFPAERVLHIPGLGFDGRIGYSVISMQRQTLGAALAADEYAARTMRNPIPSLVLKHPARFHDREAGAKNIRSAWEKAYGGPDKAGKMVILEEGMDLETIGLSPEDMQLLSTRVFYIQEIARWFNMPPHKLKEMSHATYSNIEHQQIEYVQDTIRPWLVRIETEIHRQCLTDYERKQFFAEHTMDALLRGDAESRNKAYAVMRQNGVINANDWRAWENLNPIPGKAGKTYWMPMNMVDASSEPEPVKVSPQNELPEKEEKAQAIPEQRTIRSIAERKKLAEAYRERFRSAARTIIKKDVRNVKKIARAAFSERNKLDFDNKIDDYFLGNYAFVRRQIGAVYWSYAEDIYPVAAREVNSDEPMGERYQAEVDKFIDNTSSRYISEGRNEIKKLAQKAIDEETDPIEAVDKRMEEWEEKKPDKIANWEVVAAETGLAAFVYFASNFGLRWVTIGENCPYCNALSGKVIRHGGAFLNAFENFQPEGAEKPLKRATTVRHPPAHAGCDCTVAASL